MHALARSSPTHYFGGGDLSLTESSTGLAAVSKDVIVVQMHTYQLKKTCLVLYDPPGQDNGGIWCSCSEESMGKNEQ